MTRNVKKHRYVTKEGLSAFFDKFKDWTEKDTSTFAGTAGDAEKLGGELPEHYATAQSVTDEVKARQDAVKAEADRAKTAEAELGTRVATLEAVYDSTRKMFVVSGMTVSASSLLNCRYVVQMKTKVTEVGTGGTVGLDIGGCPATIYYRGSLASVTNSWLDNDYLDVYYHKGAWRSAPCGRDKINYEIWEEIDSISKPNS